MRGDIDTSDLIKDYSSKDQGKLIGEISLNPQEQSRIRLGTFRADESLSGFSVEFDPEPFPKGSVVTQVTSLDDEKGYALTMHLANYSTKPVNAVVRQLSKS